VKFPIYGNFDQTSVIKRLLAIEKKENVGLHIQLSEIENYQRLNELLFFMLTLGALSSFEETYMIPQDCQIFIEVANTFDDKLWKNAHILRLFEFEEIR